MNNTDKPGVEVTGSQPEYKLYSVHSLGLDVNETHARLCLPSSQARGDDFSQSQISSAKEVRDESGKSKRDRSPSPFKLNDPSDEATTPGTSPDELSLSSMRLRKPSLSLFDPPKRQKTGKPFASLDQQDNDPATAGPSLFINPLGIW